MFRLGADGLLKNTDAFWLSLRSLTPINFASGPLAPAEEEGLQFVVDNPTAVGGPWLRSMQMWRASKRASHAKTVTPSRQGATSSSVADR